jgi:hypothetical protein
MRIKPGSVLTVIVDTRLNTETTDLRNTIVYDTIGEKIIIAQTDPPLLKSHNKKMITLSSLTRERGEAVRYAFSAKILDFIKDYRLSSSQTVPAIMITPKTNSQPFNLRAGYRISPPSYSGLAMSLFGYPLNLLNISITGATFSHDYDFRLKTGMMVKFFLKIDSKEYEVEAVVKRISSSENKPEGHNLEFVSVEFSKMFFEGKRALEKKIIDIQREWRSKELDI